MKLLRKLLKPIRKEHEIQKKTGYEKYEGKNVFIRTVTHHYTGKCIETTYLTMTLTKAAWIADDGRFNESMKDSSKFSEVEPYAKPITINLYSILDITEISGKLPEEVK